MITGNEVFNNEYKKRIEKICENNPDKKYLIDFVNHIASKKSYSTIWSYVFHIAKFMNEVNKQPEQLILKDYDSYIAKLEGKTSSYQIVVYTALKKFSSYLKEADITTKDYMKKKERPSYIEGIETEQKRKNGFLDKDEINTYIEQVYNGAGTDRAKARQKDWLTRDLCIIMLFLNTGMRCAALWKLDIDNIDIINKKIVTIEKGRKVSEYFLTDKMIEILSNWLSDRNNILDSVKESALFISNRRSRMTQLSISNIVNKYSINIKDKHITPHKLRATAITSVYEATGDVYVAQKFAGHSSPELTANRYIRGKEDMARQTGADIMSNFIK